MPTLSAPDNRSVPRSTKGTTKNFRNAYAYSGQRVMVQMSTAPITAILNTRTRRHGRNIGEALLALLRAAPDDGWVDLDDLMDTLYGGTDATMLALRQAVWRLRRDGHQIETLNPTRRRNDVPTGYRLIQEATA